ncbi:hypothetical protein B0H34DRAFT_687921 [Crassisporium funariophilum]|nr:hypothetical protein B0H34DRAFT_687921 [Crassisporium funariophilum]
MSSPPAPSHADDNGFHPPPEAQKQLTQVHMRSQKKPQPTVAPTPMLSKPTNQSAQQKKIPRRSSKPIINWFQRKLAGTGKGKRIENVPLTIADLGMGRNSAASNRHMGRLDAVSFARRKTRSISLNGDDDVRDFSQSYADDDTSLDQSSLNRESIWSPASAMEADDDASVRPIPPSAPPSPSPSRSSSSYLSDPRTFRSMAASTKPTTLLSIDLNGNGMAHIAQAPNHPPTQFHRFAPHVRQSSSLSNPGLLSSGASITFSALPSAQPSSRPSSLRNPGSMNSFSLSPQQLYNNGAMSSVQAPLHTTHHPRNNPRPSSPPLDNASVLTLASSAFGGPQRLGQQNYPPSAIGDSVSHYGGSITFPDGESTSHYVLGDDERLEERDMDASVRALRPRSSRRGSWESEVSRWSARIQGTGTPSLVRERSLWTSNSVRTGGFSTENGEMYETADDQTSVDPASTADLGKDVPIPEKPFETVSITIQQPDSLAVDELHKGLKTVAVTAPQAKRPLSDEHAGKDALEGMQGPRRSSTDTVAQLATTSTPPTIENLEIKEHAPEIKVSS